MNYPWQALRDQVKKFKFALTLKYEDLLMNALTKIGILNSESFITPQGINYSLLLEESELPIETKKIYQFLVFNNLHLNSTVAAKSTTDGVKQIIVSKQK